MKHLISIKVTVVTNSTIHVNLAAKSSPLCGLSKHHKSYATQMPPIEIKSITLPLFLSHWASQLPVYIPLSPPSLPVEFVFSFNCCFLTLLFKQYTFKKAIFTSHMMLYVYLYASVNLCYHTRHRMFFLPRLVLHILFCFTS